MAGQGEYRGRVGGKHLHLNQAEKGGRHKVRLTSMSMGAALLPEGQELDLSEYEGQEIGVEGYLSGDWIYSAKVVSKAK